MEKQFVPYELALKLKELGFKENCIMYYDSKGVLVNYFNLSTTVAPLWQQAFDWFRNEYKLFGLNSPLLNNEWSIVIDDVNTSNQIYWSKTISYEKARLECLKKLIELCEKEIK